MRPIGIERDDEPCGRPLHQGRLRLTLPHVGGRDYQLLRGARRERGCIRRWCDVTLRLARHSQVYRQAAQLIAANGVQIDLEPQLGLTSATLSAFGSCGHPAGAGC